MISGRAVGERLLDVEDGRQVLVLDRTGGAPRSAACSLAATTATIGSPRYSTRSSAEHWLVVGLDPDQAQDRVPVVRHVLVREYANDAGLAESAAELNAPDERVVALGTVDLDV